MLFFNRIHYDLEILSTYLNKYHTTLLIWICHIVACYFFILLSILVDCFKLNQ